MSENKKFDREIELEKLHVLKENWQRNFDIGTSLISGAFTAFIVLIVTLYFSQKLEAFTALLLTIAVGVIIYLAFASVDGRNVKFLKRYDGWIQTIEKGEPLPTISEMSKSK
jgi:xanthine/uracil permease